MPTFITRRQALAGFGLALAATPLRAAEKPDVADPLVPWKKDVKIRPVSATPDRHTIHSYYLTNPESPDGSKVLYYASTAADGHTGNLCVQDRASGQETVIARNISTEDAHRAACQQWTCGGASVAFHDVREGQWLVAVVDLATRRERIIARDHQLSFGQPAGQTLPISGCHWNPGKYRDLELADAQTGAIRTAVTAAEVEKMHGDWIAEEFKGQPISIFFPITSPDERQVFFKLASPAGGDFRSKQASHRQGLVAYDLEKSRFSFFRSKWGHPAWHPDSRHISEMGNLLFDTTDGSTVRIPNLPSLGGCHPSVSPDGRLTVQDGLLGTLGDTPGQWGIVVCDIRGEHHQVLHKFDNSRGAKSWRKNHPHPIFSADGKRIYFNVNSGDFTQLYVAEVGSV
jgi:Tol biopolymer transport system component